MSCSVFVWMADSGMALKAEPDALSDCTPRTQVCKSGARVQTPHLMLSVATFKDAMYHYVSL